MASKGRQICKSDYKQKMPQEFTSGFSTGFRLDESKFNIPAANNLYGAIIDTDILKFVSELFYQGWSVRKSSYQNFEVEHKWIQADLKLQEKEIIISGCIDPDKYTTLIEIFQCYGSLASLELYNEDFQLVKSYQSK